MENEGSPKLQACREPGKERLGEMRGRGGGGDAGGGCEVRMYGFVSLLMYSFQRDQSVDRERQ